MDQSTSRENEILEETAPYSIDAESARVRDIPERMRPRELVARLGVRSVPESVLIAIVLRSGTKGCNVVTLAERLLTRYRSLHGLATVPVAELAREKGIGPVKAQVLAAALELGRRIESEALRDATKIRTPEDAVRCIRPEARGLDHEQFWVLHLDTRNGLKGPPHVVSRGLLDASLVHPREVFREAIRQAAAAVILAHNHPSGDPTPSADDIRMTRQLVDVGRIIDIKVLDHVIVGSAARTGGVDFVSLRETGTVTF